MSNRAPSYRDEEATVDYLLRRLENRLGGRDQYEILNTLPSDHCQLGVLVPWSIDPTASTDTSPDSDEDNSLESTTAATSETGKETSNGRQTEVRTSATAILEPFSTVDEAYRRPPSSMGLVFVIESEKCQSTKVELTVGCQFSIYTRHFPTFEEQRSQVGKAAREDESEGVGSKQRTHVSLVEKCRRHDIRVPSLTFTLDTTRATQLEDDGQIQSVVGETLQLIAEDTSLRRRFDGHKVVPIAALNSSSAYDEYLSSLSGPPELPPIRASLRLRTRPTSDNQLRVELYLCNDTQRDTELPSNDYFRILADCSLQVKIVSGTLLPAELLPVPEDYQYDRSVQAVGRNVSVEVSEDMKHIRTRAMARYKQPRTTTSTRFLASYSALAEDPLRVLEGLLQAMKDYAEEWEESVIQGNVYSLSSTELHACENDLAAFQEEVTAFQTGLVALQMDVRLAKAFAAMNRAFAGGRHSHWRLFQIVFIVTQLSALAVREGFTEGTAFDGTQLSWGDILDRADVLWFSTGGGKTEAYLGLVSCAILYDRLRGKQCGVTAWLRFPLRMLSVQQLQRSIRVLWNTELQRRELAREAGVESLGESVSLGYLVGASNTPNSFYGSWAFENLRSDERLRDRLLLINDCPACGSEGSVEIELDEQVSRVRHVCRLCHTILPIYVSDDEIFRFLPSLIVGTVDKVAAVAYQPKIATIWNGPEWRCGVPEHGFGSGDWCVSGCPTNPNVQNKNRVRRQRVSPYDPVPAFHIQDELHLLQEELGAFAGHYETMIRSNEAAGGVGPAKVIAATATISGYQHQARQIYGVGAVRRIPNRGHSLLESFYTTEDRDLSSPDKPIKTMRIFAAFRPPYLRASDAAALCTEILHETINDLQSDPYGAAIRIGLRDATTEQEVRDLLAYYSRTLTYVGKRDSGTRIKEKLERDSSDLTARLRPTADRELNVEYIASHSTLREISDTIKRAESNTSWQDVAHLDATVATDVVSHGVDVERYNLMVLERIPEEIAGYVQVSSRSGRQHVGAVIAVLPRHSLRASSIYDRFNEFHRHLDRMVSPVPVNRFAKAAVSRSFPGVLLGALYGQHPGYTAGSREQRLNKLRQDLRSADSELVHADSLLSEVLACYALRQGKYDNSQEQQMIARLEQLYSRFSLDVRNPAYHDLAEIFDPRPMTSLRDVDVAVPFRPDDRQIDWGDLFFFRVGS